MVPDPARGRLIYELSPESTDEEVVQHMWNDAGADEENPQPFLKLILSRVVSVAVLSRTKNSSGEALLELHSLPKDNSRMEERALIERFLNGIGKKQPQLVGFNSFDSDLPILLQRGLVTGVTTPAFSKRPNKPWEGLDYFSRSSEAHLDIRAILRPGVRGVLHFISSPSPVVSPASLAWTVTRCLSSGMKERSGKLLTTTNGMPLPPILSG
jgi:3'-5' exonuclease